MRAIRLAFMAAGLFVVAGCITIDLPGGRPGALIETTLEGDGDAKILLLEIEGVISESAEPGPFGIIRRESHAARVRSQLRKAARDSDVVAVVLRIHSPGGTATASEIVYREIAAFKESRGVPVVAALMGVATSGAYYAAMAADSVYAHPTTVTGSIGVIFAGVNLAGLMEKLGIEDQTVVSGPHKDAGSPLRRMTAEERAHIQSVLDDLHRRFTAVVEAGRPNLTPDQVAQLADGRIFSAEQAKAAGLVDTIGDLQDAVEEAGRRAGVGRARLVSYHRSREWRENLYTQAAAPSPTLIELAAALVPVRTPTFLYLWWPGRY